MILPHCDYLWMAGTRLACTSVLNLGFVLTFKGPAIDISKCYLARRQSNRNDSVNNNYYYVFILDSTSFFTCNAISR
jgi:hypothetical protein